MVETAGHDIVVVGFSVGGINPLLQLVADLPRDLTASQFVVHHFPPQGVSALAGIPPAGPLAAIAHALEELVAAEAAP